MMTDMIADMLVRIRNANQRKHPNVSMPYSKIRGRIAEILETGGYISGFKVYGSVATKTLKIFLKYPENKTQKAIQGLKRISKPGLRVYVKKSKIPYVLNGLGIAIISTPKGIIIDAEARAQNVGGEILAYI